MNLCGKRYLKCYLCNTIQQCKTLSIVDMFKNCIISNNMNLCKWFWKTYSGKLNGNFLEEF